MTKKKLGKLTINGKPADTEEFVKDFEKKYGVNIEETMKSAGKLSNSKEVEESLWARLTRRNRG